MYKTIFKKFTLTLSSVGLATSFAFANPEADQMNTKPEAEDVLLVRTSKEGNKEFYKLNNVSPVDVPEAIKQFESNVKNGKKDPNVVKVKTTKVNVRDPKNPEAEGDVSEQTWFYYYNNYRYGWNPGYNYYYNTWPTYYYYNNWAPTYRWCYGYSSYTYGIYW